MVQLKWNNSFLYLKHLTAIHMAFCFEKKRKKNKVCCHIWSCFVCLGWFGEHVSYWYSVLVLNSSLHAFSGNPGCPSCTYHEKWSVCSHAPKGADTQTHYRLHKVVQRTYSESVTDTAFLYWFPVCILVQETWDVPYAHIKWSVRSPQRGKTLWRSAACLLRRMWSTKA